MGRPRLLDLFCGAGGAAMGYHRAGFEVTGVDIKPQPRYPFAFVQGDGLKYVAAHGYEYDAIHASPPCQGYSIMRNLPWLRGKEYPLLIEPTRALLMNTGRPYVIENVMGAKLAAGWLCGTMFGLRIFRHRFFEAGRWMWLQPPHAPHRHKIRASNTLGGRARTIVFSDAEDARGIKSWPGRRGLAGHGLTRCQNGEQAGAVAVGVPAVGCGHARGAAAAAAVEMGVEWMRPHEVSQAIPPAYTEFIGRQLLTAMS